MKTLRRLVVSHRPITNAVKRHQEEAADIMSIPTRLKVVNEYRHIPGLLDMITLESDNDIEEQSLKTAIGDMGDNLIAYLPLTDSDWETLGIRKTLFGQSREITDRGYTYGRPRTGKYKQAHKYKAPVNKLSEEALVAWHETDHVIRSINDIDPTSTHYHFYGYASKYEKKSKAEQNEIRPRRFVRTPDPLQAWHAIPWETLRVLELNTPAPPVDNKKKIAILMQIVAALQQMLALLVKQQKTLVKPLRNWDTERVSQPYGQYNPAMYKLTEHHIGVDHAVEEDTRLYAPDDGEIIEAGYNDILGNYYVYQYAPDRWLVNLHLRNKPKLGAYKAGEVLGHVGSTGFITGTHAHTEVWKTKPVRASISGTINKQNWASVTLDPLKVF